MTNKRDEESQTDAQGRIYSCLHDQEVTSWFPAPLRKKVERAVETGNAQGLEADGIRKSDGGKVLVELVTVEGRRFLVDARTAQVTVPGTEEWELTLV